MKTSRILTALVILAAAVACNSNKPAGSEIAASAETKALLPSKSLIDSVSYLMGINFGAEIKNYNLGELNYAQIRKGMQDFLGAEGSQRDTNFVKQFKINPMEMNQIMINFIEKRNAFTAAANKEAEDKFLSEVRAKDGVEVTGTGLTYLIQEPGNDNKPGEKDTVYVHYKLAMRDGTVVEEISEDQASVMMMLNMVIPGWTEGLQLLGEGGKATLYVPAELGYGERGNNGIEPNSTLVFDIKLDSVKHFVAPEPVVLKK